MASPTAQALSRSGDRIRAISSSAPDAVALRSAVLDELRTSFAFDAHVWLLTDPVTGVGCAPLAHVPLSDDLPMLIRLKYLTDINRWTALARGPHHARSLLQATGNEPVRSLIWREILRDHEVVDVLSIVFADRHGCWGFLDLWRQKPADSLEIFSLAFGLSGRERELVELLAAGGDTREVANRLFVTEHTVQDHLKSIFEKTSTRSRRTLLSRALGMRPRPRGEVTADARIDDAAEKRGN